MRRELIKERLNTQARFIQMRNQTYALDFYYNHSIDLECISQKESRSKRKESLEREIEEKGNLKSSSDQDLIKELRRRGFQKSPYPKTVRVIKT